MQGTCPNADQLCKTDGTCGCLTANDGTGVPGDNTAQGSCPDDGTICRSDGTCGCLTTADGTGMAGDGTGMGTCTADNCQADGTCAPWSKNWSKKQKLHNLKKFDRYSSYQNQFFQLKGKMTFE